MKVRTLICLLLVGLLLSGCIYVKVEGRPCRHCGEWIETLEECQCELDECECEHDDQDDDE